MADNGYKTITRVIEYYGPPEWLESTLAASRIPIQGVKQFANGVYIKGGIVIYQPDEITESQVEEAETDNNSDKVKTVTFKRPGEN